MTQPDHSEILVQVFGRTDVGRTREHNEDAYVVADLSTNDASLQPSVRKHRVGPKGTLFMVADGMGGAAAGEIASQMASEIVLKELRENWLPLETPTAEAFAKCLKRAAQIANQQIHNYATSHTEFRGMGTTATIAGLLADTLYLAQVGDSRAYLVRDGEAKQITKDQSLMQKLIEAGELTEEEASQSERRNIILQALGPEPTIKVDLTYQRIRRGDTLVLCSDGLSGQVGRDEIARVVSEETDLVAACRRLIDMANTAGGPDNITVIIARFLGEGLNEMGEGDDVGHRVFALADSGNTPPVGIERMLDDDPTLPIRHDRVTTPSSFIRTSMPTPSPQSVPAIDSEGEDESESESPPKSLPGPVPGDDVMFAADDSDPTLRTLTAAKQPQRRSRGMVIAIALLALMIVFAAWFALRTVKKVQPDPTPANPAAPAP